MPFDLPFSLAQLVGDNRPDPNDRAAVDAAALQGLGSLAVASLSMLGLH